MIILKELGVGHVLSADIILVDFLLLMFWVGGILALKGVCCLEGKSAGE